MFFSGDTGPETKIKHDAITSSLLVNRVIVSGRMTLEHRNSDGGSISVSAGDHPL